MGFCDESELVWQFVDESNVSVELWMQAHLRSPPSLSRLFLSLLLDGSRWFFKLSFDMAWLVNLEIPWPHWLFDRKRCIELTLSRRNNKNSSQSFICRILLAAHSVKIMAEIQRRIRFNTISMSVLMITIAVGVMTAMWMYADSIVWFFKKLLWHILCCLQVVFRIFL